MNGRCTWSGNAEGLGQGGTGWHAPSRSHTSGNVVDVSLSRCSRVARQLARRAAANESRKRVAPVRAIRAFDRFTLETDSRLTADRNTVGSLRGCLPVALHTRRRGSRPAGAARRDPSRKRLPFSGCLARNSHGHHSSMGEPVTAPGPGVPVPVPEPPGPDLFPEPGASAGPAATGRTPITRSADTAGPRAA